MTRNRTESRLPLQGTFEFTKRISHERSRFRSTLSGGYGYGSVSQMRKLRPSKGRVPSNSWQSQDKNLTPVQAVMAPIGLRKLSRNFFQKCLKVTHIFHQDVCHASSGSQHTSSRRLFPLQSGPHTHSGAEAGGLAPGHRRGLRGEASAPWAWCWHTAGAQSTLTAAGGESELI